MSNNNKNWTALLQFARTVGAETVPPSFKSRVELQTQFSLARRQTDEVVRKLIDAGKIEVRKFKVATGAGVRLVPHYRIKP